MLNDNLFSRSLVIQTVLFVAVTFGLGLAVNYRLVARGFDGSLVMGIKELLREQIEATARSSASDSREQQIIIMDLPETKAFFDSRQALFVDARPAGAYGAGHIAGAFNINEQNFDEYLFDLADPARQTRIIVYCTNPQCPQALELAELLVEHDIRPVHLYPGGWEEWSARALPAAEGREP